MALSVTDNLSGNGPGSDHYPTERLRIMRTKLISGLTALALVAAAAPAMAGGHGGGRTNHAGTRISSNVASHGKGYNAGNQTRGNQTRGTVNNALSISGSFGTHF